VDAGPAGSWLDTSVLGMSMPVLLGVGGASLVLIFALAACSCVALRSAARHEAEEQVCER
jgi:hypothetical protein